MFEFYWNYFGLWFSVLKGKITDSSSIQFTEILVWLGLIFSCIFIRRLWIHGKQYFYPGSYSFIGPLKKFTWLTFIFGPFLLMLLIMGQGATTIAPFPTYLRKSPAEKIEIYNISEEKIKSLVKHSEGTLHLNFDSTVYNNYDEDFILSKCNSEMNHVLDKMQLSPGRDLKKVKTQKGLTRLFGLSYGGPGYHDPLTGEVAVASFEDYPTPKYWRIHAICHETAHAKGFTREVDAEILTFLTLVHSDNFMLRSTGAIQFLNKSGYKWEVPATLQEEIKSARRLRKKAEEKQWMIRFLRDINKKLSIQNDAKKYGDRDKKEKWDPEHPFFSTVVYYSEMWNLQNLTHE